MLPVVKINNLYKEITIPVNESITADMLLDKYGIVADVEIVGQSGGGSDLTFPYNLFHSFFSLFTPSKGMDKVMVTEEEDKVMVTKDEDKVMVTKGEEVKDEEVKDMVTKDEDKDEVMDTKGDEVKDEDEDKDEDVKVTKDDEVKVTEDKDKDEEGVNTIGSKKVMKITIKSINGLRPW